MTRPIISENRKQRERRLERERIGADAQREKWRVRRAAQRAKRGKKLRPRTLAELERENEAAFSAEEGLMSLREIERITDIPYHEVRKLLLSGLSKLRTARA